MYSAEHIPNTTTEFACYRTEARGTRAVARFTSLYATGRPSAGGVMIHSGAWRACPGHWLPHTSGIKPLHFRRKEI